MFLKLKIENEELKKLYEDHSSYHEGDAGLDLFCPEDITIPAGKLGKVDLGVACEALERIPTKHFCGVLHYLLLGLSFILYLILVTSDYSKASELTLGIYLSLSAILLGVLKITNFSKLEGVSFYMYPRSSIIKTPLRLANSVGIIDRGYRGNLMACFDNTSQEDYTIQKGTRLVQICSADLKSVSFTLADSLSDTTRGRGGYGSTGV